MEVLDERTPLGGLPSARSHTTVHHPRMVPCPPASLARFLDRNFTFALGLMHQQCFQTVSDIQMLKVLLELSS